MRLWRERGIKGVRVPLWGWRGIPSPKCDTNPLTPPEHPCYYPHRSNTTLTISRRNQNPGSPPGPPEDSTLQPIPTALAQARGTSWNIRLRRGKRNVRLRRNAISSLHRVPCTFPTPRRWKDALDRAIADRPYPPRPRLGGRLAASLRYIKHGVADRLSPAETTSRRLARLASLRHIKQGADGPPRPSGGPRNKGF